MGSIWEDTFNQLAENYGFKIQNKTDNITVKIKNAEVFFSHIDDAIEKFPDLISLLSNELQNKSADVLRLSTALRILTEIDDQQVNDVIANFLENTDKPSIWKQVIQLIGKKQQLSPEIWHRLYEQRKVIHPEYETDFLQVLLHYPTPQAYSLIEQNLDNIQASRIIPKCLAQWDDTQKLHQIIDEIPVTKDEFNLPDIKLEAAFRLGLLGDTYGIQYLSEVSSDKDLIRAANATYLTCLFGIAVCYRTH